MPAHIQVDEMVPISFYDQLFYWLINRVLNRTVSLSCAIGNIIQRANWQNFRPEKNTFIYISHTKDKSGIGATVKKK